MSQWQEAKISVLEAARQISLRGLVVGTCGNISLRLSGNLLAITPSGRHYDSLVADDIQIVDFDGNSVEGDLNPSMETMLHIGIYRARENVNAIIHTHSTYASAAAVAGQEIPPVLDDQVAFIGGKIKLAPYTISGTSEQVTTIIKALEDRSGVLLANHGAIGTGRSMRDAFITCEIIEKSAKVYLLALSTGNINYLPTNAIAAARAIYDRLQKIQS